MLMSQKEKSTYLCWTTVNDTLTENFVRGAHILIMYCSVQY